MLASARRRAWRMAGVCGLAPVYGRNVGRAISPAAGAWHHRRVSGTMRASSPTGAGQGPAGPCRIFLPLTGNAPLRLRLAAHPPPLAGEALGGAAAYKASPVRGCGVERRLRRIQRDGAGAAVAERKCASAHAAQCGHRKPVMSPQATEGCGTLPCEYPSGLAPAPPAGLTDGRRLCVAARSRPQCRAGEIARRLGPLRHRRVSGTMRASSPTGAGQGSAGPCRIFRPQSGNAPLRLRLAAQTPPLAGEALGGLPPCVGADAGARPRFCSSSPKNGNSSPECAGDLLLW